MARSWLDSLDDITRRLLAGSTGDFRDGIASETAQQWLQQIGYSKRRRLADESVVNALTRAVGESLFRTVAGMPLDPETAVRWILILDRWLKQGTVNHELSRLLTPASGPLDLSRLNESLQMVASTTAATPVSGDVPKPHALDFVEGFQRCVQREPILSKAIGREALNKMVIHSTRSMTDTAVASGVEILESNSENPPVAPPKFPTFGKPWGGLALNRGLATESEASARDPGKPEKKRSSDELFASHWVEDNQDQVHDMGVILQVGLDYWYGFRVSREIRAGASADPFTEPAKLKEREKSVVFVEVTSELLGPEKFERRRTVHTRGEGIPDQYFRLRGVAPGSVPFRVQIVHDNLPVYSRAWELRVSEGPAPVSVPPRAEEEGARPQPQQLGAVTGFGFAFRNAFRLKCDKERLELLSPDMQSWPGIVTSLIKDPKIRMVSARRTLHEFAEAHGQEKSFTKATVRDFLQKMAVWGRNCYDLLFDDANQTLRDTVLGKLPPGSLLTIDTDAPSFPWEWLYMGEVPGKDEDFLRPEARGKFIDGFWGIHFGLSVLPTISGNRIGLRPVLSNSGRTRVLSSINPTAYPETAKGNIELMQSLPQSFTQVTTEIAQGRDETIKMLRRQTEPKDIPHFLYFYCHHKAGQTLDQHGFLNDDESVLFLRGEEEDSLSVSDLKYDLRLAPFLVPQTPLVFLNACGSSQGQDFHPSGFVPYFTHQLLASTVIGTLAEIPAGQGLKMATDFLTLWFRGMPAATVLQFLRRRWLEEELNPFAMYYTLNGIANLSLEQRLP